MPPASSPASSGSTMSAASPSGEAGAFVTATTRAAPSVARRRLDRLGRRPARRDRDHELVGRRRRRGCGRGVLDGRVDPAAPQARARRERRVARAAHPDEENAPLVDVADGDERASRALVGVEQRAERLRLGQDVGQERLARQAHSPTSRESRSSAPAAAIGSHSGRNDVRIGELVGGLLGLERPQQGVVESRGACVSQHKRRLGVRLEERCPARGCPLLREAARLRAGPAAPRAARGRSSAASRRRRAAGSRAPAAPRGAGSARPRSRSRRSRAGARRIWPTW